MTDPTVPAVEPDHRIAAAGALRDLNHAFVGHDVGPERAGELAAQWSATAAELRANARRDRLALMRAAAAAAAEDGDTRQFVGQRPQSGFEDRAVAGHANPTSIEFEVSDDGDDVLARFVLRRAFEGAPQRAHGGMVAAAFDDVTGWVIGRLHEPAFTGELTVRFLAPVPVDEALEVRTRLVGRERRKLYITAEMTAAGVEIATCKAIYITVDPSVFASAPDPR